MFNEDLQHQIQQKNAQNSRKAKSKRFTSLKIRRQTINSQKGSDPYQVHQDFTSNDAVIDIPFSGIMHSHLRPQTRASHQRKSINQSTNCRNQSLPRTFTNKNRSLTPQFSRSHRNIDRKFTFWITNEGNNSKLICDTLLRRHNWSQSTERSGNFVWGTSINHINFEFRSRIEGSNELTDKVKLYENVESFCLKNKISSSNFMPITCCFKTKDDRKCLSINLNEFIEMFEYIGRNTTLANVWIFKPSHLNRGQQIALFNSLEGLAKNFDLYSRPPPRLRGSLSAKVIVAAESESLLSKLQGYLSRGHNFVIQKYVQNPMLIEGRKFDIRMWVLVDQDRNVYLYREGYLRFSSYSYSLSGQSLKDNFVHLTNNAIQKNCSGYDAKRNLKPMSFIKEHIKSGASSSYEKIIKNIEFIVCITIAASFRKIQQKANQFQLYGYDFLLDRNLNVRLIEANSNPSITEDCEYLRQIIPTMIDDTFKITIDRFFEQRKISVFETQWRKIAVVGEIPQGNFEPL